MTREEPSRRRLLDVALGAGPADLLALGADVVNVYTGEVVRGDVAVADGRIAAVGPDLTALAGPATERLDVRGKVLVPGFLDGHTHLDVFVTLPALLREAIPRGSLSAQRSIGGFESSSFPALTQNAALISERGVLCI